MRTLGWLFIILCAQALLSLAIEIFPTTKHHTPEGLNAVNGTTSLHGGRGERRDELKQAKFYPIKRQKGKGSYGGANIDRRPRPVKSAASLPKKSHFSILSTNILCAGFSLVLGHNRVLCRIFLRTQITESDEEIVLADEDGRHESVRVVQPSSSSCCSSSSSCGSSVITHEVTSSWLGHEETSGCDGLSPFHYQGGP